MGLSCILLQLLTVDMPLATILGMLATTWLQAIADRGLVQAPPTPSVSGTPVLQVGRKCWCHSSDQESQREAFSKESDIMKVARWVKQKTHWVNFEQEGLYDLSSVFYQMAILSNLLNTKVYEVQKTWGSQKDLGVTNQVAGAFPKCIHFFQVISHTESPKIMGLKGIHSSEALWQQGGLTFCPWCGKEGQNEGTVVNHLQTMQYHLGLNYACCLDHLTTNAKAMHCHAHVCKPSTTGNNDNDREEDYEDDDNSDEDSEFKLEEDYLP